MKFWKFVWVGVALSTAVDAAVEDLKGLKSGCPEAIYEFNEERFVKNEVVSEGNHRRLKVELTAANRAYFSRNRDNLRTFVKNLDQKYFKLRHVYSSILMAHLMGTHAYVGGESGAAKSKLTQEIQSLPVRLPTGELARDLFELQLNPMVSDLLLRGYVDPKKLNGRAPTVDDIEDQGTMVRYLRATLEEADKGNPLAFAAALDAMNERVARHGGVVRHARTRTVVTLTNVTVYDFLKIFADLGMEPTGRAFVERMPFKSYAPDYIVDDETGIRALQEGTRQGVDRAANLFDDPLQIFRLSGEVGSDRSPHPSMNDEINLLWLGAFANTAAVTDPTFYPGMRKIFSDLRVGYRQMRKDGEKAIADRKVPPDTAPYFPTSTASTRTQMNFGMRVVSTSLLFRLLLLEEKELPTNQLLAMLAEGRFVVSPISLWRLSDSHITAVPGDPGLVVRSKARANALELDFQTDLKGLAQFAHGAREETMLGYFQQEHDVFQNSYTQVLQSRADSAQALAAFLLSRRGTKQPPDLEAYFLRRR
jgi:hypothetical protein